MLSIPFSAVCLLAGAATPETPADDLVAHWVFTEEHYEDGAFRPLEGDWPLSLAEPTFVGEGDRQALLLSLAPQLMLVGKAMDPARLPTRTCTIEAWISMDTAPKWGGIFSSIEDNGSEETGLLLGSRGKNFAFAVSSTGADDGDGTLTYLTASVAFQPGRWYHVVGTYDGKTQRIFVNGEASGESLVQSGPLLYSKHHTVAVGAYKDTNEDYRLSGALHEVALYDEALKLPEIQRRYRKLKASCPLPLAAPLTICPYPVLRRCPSCSPPLEVLSNGAWSGSCWSSTAMVHGATPRAATVTAPPASLSTRSSSAACSRITQPSCVGCSSCARVTPPRSTRRGFS